MWGVWLFRLVFTLALGSVAVPSWSQLTSHVTWQRHVTLAEDLLRRRVVLEDLAPLAPFLAHGPPEDCRVLRNGAPVTLHMHANDVIARAAGVNPFRPDDDPGLRAQRDAAHATIAQALVCAPMDGNLWLNMAIIARARGENRAQVAQYLALSERYAPHEGWISLRRAQLF